MSSALERVRKLAAEVLNVPPDSVTLESSHETIGTWDSLATVNLVIAVENEFGVSVDIKNVDAFRSVKGIVDVVNGGG